MANNLEMLEKVDAIIVDLEKKQLKVSYKRCYFHCYGPNVCVPSLNLYVELYVPIVIYGGGAFWWVIRS